MSIGISPSYALRQYAREHGARHRQHCRCGGTFLVKFEVYVFHGRVSSSLAAVSWRDHRLDIVSADHTCHMGNSLERRANCPIWARALDKEDDGGLRPSWIPTWIRLNLTNKNGHGVTFSAPVRDLRNVPAEVFEKSGEMDDLLLGLLGPGSDIPEYVENVRSRVGHRPKRPARPPSRSLPPSPKRPRH